MAWQTWMNRSSRSLVVRWFWSQYSVIANAPHQFHHEIGPARLGRARIQHLGDVRMIHHRQRLPLRLEPRDHRLVSIPSLMTFSATRRRTGSVCSAIYTTPQPPSPIRSSNLYRPSVWPTASSGASARSSLMVALTFGPGGGQHSGWSCAASRASRRAAGPLHLRLRRF